MVLNKDLWIKIDELRFSGLTMEFVKGHSGDTSNERVDLIASNFSKGISTDLTNSKRRFISNEETLIAAPKLQDLYSRLELISGFVEKGY